MNEEVNRTLHLIRHDLETLVYDLGRPPVRATARQRCEGTLALLLMLERQLTEGKL
jgi:hypothetical protein